MALAHIESAADPRLDTFRFVGDAAELGRRGLVVVEGRLVVERLLAESSLEVDALLLTDVRRLSSPLPLSGPVLRAVDFRPPQSLALLPRHSPLNEFCLPAPPPPHTLSRRRRE